MAHVPVRGVLPPNAGSIDPEVPVPAAKRPNIKVTASEPERRFVGPLPMAIGLVALAAMLGFIVRAHSTAIDPFYRHATESLNVYEAGRPELERNYDAPIYTEALDDLAKVAADSRSAPAAAALVEDIKFRTDAFHRRVKAREVADNAVIEARREREREYEVNRRRTLMAPRKEFPECHEEVKGHAK